MEKRINKTGELISEEFRRFGFADVKLPNLEDSLYSRVSISQRGNKISITFNTDEGYRSINFEAENQLRVMTSIISGEES